MVEYENDFRSNLCKITKTFCKLSKLRCEIELDLLHLWYEICQQAPTAVRLIVYKEDAVNWLVNDTHILVKFREKNWLPHANKNDFCL